MKSFRSKVLSTLVLSACVACGNPASSTPADGSASAAKNVSEPLAHTVSRALTGFTTVFAGGTPDAQSPANAAASNVAALGSAKHVLRTNALGRSLPTADEVAMYLQLKIFAASNVESQNGDTTTFLLSGETLCGGNDANCVKSVDTAQVRLVVTGADKSASVLVQLGPEKAVAATVQVTRAPDSVTCDLDLAALPKLTALAASIQGQQPQPFIGTVSGHIALSSKVDDGRADVQFSVVQPVSYSQDSKNGPRSISVAVSKPLLGLSATGSQWTATGNLGAVQVIWPYADVVTSDSAQGALQLTLAGLTFTGTSDENNPSQAKFTGVTLGKGPSTLRKDSTDLASLEVNAGQAQGFDFSVTSDAQGQETVTLSPALVLDAKWDLRPIAADLPHGTPQAQLTNSLNVALKGEPAVVQPRKDGIKLVKGSLVLTSQQSALSVGENLCLTKELNRTVVKDPVLGQFSAGTCQ